MRKSLTLAFAVLAGCSVAMAQSDNKLTVSGSIQSDILIQGKERSYGSDDAVCTNTYADVTVANSWFDAGARLEYLDHPLPGFENDFKGWGLANIYARLRHEKFEATVGSFYEQFGSGFILRTYEERSLGVDNSLLGARAIVRPFKGIQLKALTGAQRHYWEFNKSLISGADVELSLDQWIRGLSNADTYLTLGGSWVNKYEEAHLDEIYADATHQLLLPEHVNAFDVRANLQKGAFSLLAEYAQKSQDPTFDNGYIYRKGYVGMLSTSYSKSGMSVLLQAKRSDNFSFRSRRTVNGTSSFINHLPAFTEDHTYALASMYPYATNPDGEWAYQAQFGYKFKRKSTIGGKYGMNVKVNLSYVNSIDKTLHGSSVLPSLPAGGKGTDGYGSPFWKWGDEKYYQDLNVQVDRRFSKAFKLNLMYMNQVYNKTAIEGEGGMVHSNIFVADGLFNITNKTALRAEAQYLATADDKGDWLFGLLELSFAPHWMVTVSDEYNCGTTKEHFWQLSATYNIKSHRIQLGWGRTREGFNCSGGVCRYVPETKGFTLSYNYNF